VRRIYIPLPDAASRRALISLLLTKQGPGGADMLQPRHLERVVAMTDGYSGSDLTAVRTPPASRWWSTYDRACGCV
jgi:spastin